MFGVHAYMKHYTVKRETIKLSTKKKPRPTRRNSTIIIYLQLDLKDRGYRARVINITNFGDARRLLPFRSRDLIHKRARFAYEMSKYFRTTGTGYTIDPKQDNASK